MKRLLVNGLESKHYHADKEGNIYSVIGDKVRKLRQHKTHDGYNRIHLHVDVPKGNYRVCRLIAETFLDNEDNMPIVHHINEVRDDDRVVNLMWCDNSYNQKQRFITGEATNTKKVVRINRETMIIEKEYNTMKEASEDTTAHAQNISKVCRGLRREAGGYIWKYADCPSVETMRKQ